MHTLAAVLAAASLAVPAAALASNDEVTGNGQPSTTVRELAPFERIRVDGPLDVRVTVGGAQRVEVIIDANLQERVRTDVRGTELRVEVERRTRIPRGARVEVTVPALRALGLRGSGDVRIEGGQGDLELSVSGSGDLAWKGAADALAVSLAGSGDVSLDGRAETFSASVAGSGDVRAKALTTRSAQVSIAGSGDVAVTLAGGTLDASIVGSGDVVWYGDATVSRSVVGSGEVAHR